MKAITNSAVFESLSTDTPQYLASLLVLLFSFFHKPARSLRQAIINIHLASNLKSLELRRLRFDLIQYYKIPNNLTPHLNTLLIINRFLPLVNQHYFLTSPSKVLITFYHYSSTDQWTAGIHFLKHSKGLILLVE